MNIVIKFVNIYIYIKCYTFIKFKGALDMEHLIWLG